MSTDWLAAYPQYLQLFAVGMLWINIHCAGMCGPLVVGLDLGGTLQGIGAAPGALPPRRQRLWAAFGNLSFYQLGRSTTYGVLGGLAGWGGLVLQDLFQSITRIGGLVVGAILLAMGIGALVRPGSALGTGGATKPGRTLGALVRRVRGLHGRRQKYLLGVILGFLPCMIPVWVLGLAASTQSPLHGAVLMILLVWMTSIVIFGFGMAPALANSPRGRLRERLLPVLLMISGLWMGLIAAAANNWIGHASVGFTLGGRGFAIMFW